MTDIKDNEIRFIGDENIFDPVVQQNELEKQKKERSEESLCLNESISEDSESSEVRHYRYKELSEIKEDNGFGKSKWIIVFVSILLAILLLLIYLAFHLLNNKNAVNNQPSINNDIEIERDIDAVIIESEFENLSSTTDYTELDNILNISSVSSSGQAYCRTVETSVNDISVRIYLTENAIPELHIGNIDKSDAAIVLAMQAADIRKDNGEIVGACVYHGEVAGKGLSKRGYVAIIDGKMKVGVSDHSPLFEEAIEKGGDFFRQYPLVDNGKLVENNPKNISIRRAICERRGQYFVTETLVPVSLHDFSQLLIDMQVRNAVYLVGSQYACGMMRDENQQLTEWGETKYSNLKNVSYLIWRKR